MTTSIHGRTVLGLASMAMLISAQALAQQPAPAQPGQPVRQAIQNRAQQAQNALQQNVQRTVQRPIAGRGTQADAEIATWLILANEKEAAISQAAAQKAKHDSVKQFAQKMAEEHSKTANQLRAFAPNTPRLSADAAQQRTADRDGQNENRQNEQAQNEPNRQNEPARTDPNSDQNRPALAQDQNRGQGLPMDRIAAEMAQRSLATCLQELSAKQGDEYDHCFMAGQVMGHQENWIALETLKKYASPELQSQLQQAVQTTEHHLTQAREICEQLKGSHAAAEQKTGAQENQKRDSNESK